MMPEVPCLLADCSVVLKWKLIAEPHANHARELLRDWEQDAIEVCVPDQLLTEIASAVLSATRKHPPRLTPAEATQTLQELLDMPFTIFKSTGKKILARALEIAHRHNQRVYDCVYVALAERKHVELWTGDVRLYNAFHTVFPFIRKIADYTCRRPSS